MIKVSVIIPVYNVENYLKECLDSVINQTLKEIEIICINDGSTDNSGEILQKYKKKDSRISVYEKVNGGLSSARNTGLSKAIGKYIYFMDSDDYLETEALEILFNQSEKLTLDILYFSGKSFWENETLKESRSHLKNYYERVSMERVLSGIDMMRELHINGCYLVSACLQFINRKFLEKIGISFYEGIIHEDNLFTFLTMIKAQRTACIETILFNRRIRENSITTNKEGIKNAIGYYVCLKEIFHYIENHIFLPKEERTLIIILNELTNNFIRIYSSIPEPEEKKIMEKNSPIENYLFKTYVQPQKVIEKLKSNHKILEENYNLILKSRSFKIGCAITYIPRKLRGLIWLLKNKGIRYTLLRIRIKIKK